MANSSFNSSFSLKDATARQCEEAFEELYLQSPLPKSSKPFFAAREKLMAPPVVPGQSRLKIKAIFDTMKERNSSMCSELNSSISTPNASFSEVGAEARSHPAKDGEQRVGEKENQAPSPDRNQDEVDHLAEISHSPNNSHLPPAPQSPAVRVALNFARHVAQLDSLSVPTSSGRERTQARPAPTVTDKTAKDFVSLESYPPKKKLCNRRAADVCAVSGDTRGSGEEVSDKTAKNVVGQESCPPKNNLCNRRAADVCAVSIKSRQATDSGDTRGVESCPPKNNLCNRRAADICAVSIKSRQATDSGDTRGVESCPPKKKLCNRRAADICAVSIKSKVTDSGDTRRNSEEGAENATEEVCLPHCNVSEEEVAVQNVPEKSTKWQTALSTTVTLEPPTTTRSPADKTSDESCADQETLKLASKLAQRLQSSSEKNRDSDDPDNDDDDDDEWDHVFKLVSSPSKEKSAESMALSKNAQCFVVLDQNMGGADKLSKTVDVSAKNTNVSDERKTAANYKKKGSENQTADKPTSNTAAHEKKKTWTGTLRTRKRGLAVVPNEQEKDPRVGEKSVSSEQEKDTRAGKKSVSKSRQKKGTEKQDTGDSVEADVVTQKRVKPVEGVKDPFSLDISSDDGDLHVEEDAVACATKKAENGRPPRRKAAEAVNRRKPVSQPAGKAQRTGANAAAASKKSKMLKLSCWSLQPVARLKSVRIEGKLPNTDYFWLSSVVVERVSSRIVKSTNGSLYQLVGNMAVLNTRAAGFSAEITQLFRRGFPVDWKELLESSVGSAELQSRTLLTSTLPIHAKENGKTVAGKPSTKKATKTGKSSPPRQNVKKATDPSSFHTPQRTQEDMEDSSAIWTPQGVMSRVMGAKDVRRTQSGRCVIPPLARWAGQYMERDPDGNVTIGFASLAAEQHFARIAEHEMHAPLRLRNSPMCTRIKKIKTGRSSKASPLSQQSKVAVTPLSSKGKENTLSSHNGVAKKVSWREGKDDSSNSEITSLEEEVMSVIQKSKAKRLQKAAGKRVTCYSNAANGNGQVTDKPVVSQSLDGEEEDVVSQRNPGRTAASVAKSSKGSAENVPEKTGPKGKIQTRKRQAAKAAKTRAAKQKQDVGVSDSDSTETQQNRIDTNSRARKPRAAAAASRGGKKAESVITIDSSNTEDSCGENDANELHLTKTVSSAPSSALTTNVVSKNGRQRKGPSKTNVSDNTDSKTTNPNSKNLRSRQPKVNGSRKKLDQEDDRLSDIDEKLSIDHSDFEEGGEKKSGDSRKRAQNRTRKQQQQQQQQPHPEKGQKKTVGSKAKSSKSVPKEKMTSADLDGSCPWSQEEIQNLHRGIENISSDHPNYWGAVSQYVEGRTSKECAAFYLKDNTDKGPTRKPKERKEKQDDKTPVVRGKRGTLKRRQELRAMLEHNRNGNNNNTEDLFSATPFRVAKRPKIAAIDFSKTDEEVFGRNPNFFTPRMGEGQVMGGAISHTPASMRKTPAITVTNSPWVSKDSAQKRDIDVYLYRLQKNKRQLTKSFSKMKNQQCKEGGVGTPCSTSVRLFDQSPPTDGLFRITEEQSDKEGDEEDYYYSEDEH